MLTLEEEVCYHEAGHAIVGLSYGWKLTSVAAREDGTGEAMWLRVYDGSSLLELKRKLTHAVAGEYGEGKLLDVYDNLVSRRIEAGEIGETGPFGQNDTFKSLRDAREICRRLKLKQLGQWDERKLVRRKCTSGYPSFHMTQAGLYWSCYGVQPPDVTFEEILAEVVRAEDRAARVVDKHWRAVEAVAYALLDSPNGILTGEQVTELVDRHGLPVSVQERARRNQDE
ncbi:MAG: hypothetical protein C0467_16155 [Planctomycetaceae bacterium]|nr:hypothetical protein [Planctomycetaceae bacterium]